MKTLKPQTLSILTRPFELADRFMLSMAGIVCVDFGDPRKLAHEAALWLAVQEHLGESPLDEVMPKPRGELLVAGAACAKRGTQTTAAGVRVELKRGERVLVNKLLNVVGDRTWERFGMSQAAPFSSMPVSWSRAFGGVDYDANPVGRGLAPVEENGAKVHRLPNVEDPASPITGPGDRPTPVGFGPLDIRRKERMSRAGTYDKAWLDKLYPAPPEDFHMEFYNVAPLDQRIPGFFDGSEVVRVEGMHPDHRWLEAKLPPLTVKFFLGRKGRASPRDVEEHRGRLDTVVALPTSGKLALIFRAVAPIETDDAHDVEVILGAVEAVDAPKPLEHYRAALEVRLDPERALYALLNDHELLPDWNVDTNAAIHDTFGETAKAFTPEGHTFAFVERAFESNVKKMRERIVADGLDPSDFDREVAQIRKDREAEQVPKRLEDLGGFLQRIDEQAKAARREAAEKLKELEAQARAQMAKLGRDYDEVAKAAVRETGPPDCFADRHLERMRDLATLIRNAGADASKLEAQLADRELEGHLRDAEAKLLDVYRKGGHMLDPVIGTISPEEARRRGELLLARCRDEARVDNLDLTHADLSGLDFSGLSLKGALLENAALRGARFQGSDLSDVILARATIEDCNFEGAKLAWANLGSARVRGSSFARADLTDAVLLEATFEASSLAGAALGGVNTTKVKMLGVDLSGANAKGAMFLELSLTDCKLDGADLTEASLMESRLERCSFARATFKKLTAFMTRGEACSFDEADLREARLVQVELPGATFAGARLGNTLIRDCKLEGAMLEGVSAEDCDFSGSDLSGANLTRVSGRRSLFIRTVLDRAVARKIDLMNASLQKASIRGADLRGANCFRADFARAVGDDKTDFSGAYIKETRTVRDPKSKKPLFAP